MIVSPETRMIGEHLLKILPITDIKLIPAANRVTVEDLRRLVPTGDIVACDFYVESIESGDCQDFGYAVDSILNIDHHAPTSKMRCQISSGNLAAAYVTAHGTVDADATVIINHTDCDSVISSLIMRGHLPPEKMFREAVLDADHTGAENPIADLLQSLDKARDLNFSVRNLAFLLTGAPLEEKALELLNVRLEERARVQKIKEEQSISFHGPIGLIVTDKRISSEFLPVLDPDTSIWMLASPHPASTTTNLLWEVKLRLGDAAPQQFALPVDLIRSFDPNYGGRWNAGSNRRGGGTPINPEEYARLLRSVVEAPLP